MESKSVLRTSAILGVIAVALFSTIILTVDSAKLDIQKAENNNLYLTGVYTVILQDKDGNVLSYQQMENLVPNEGLECSADLIFGTTGCAGEAFNQFIGIGTSAVAPADGDLALGAESGTCARIQDASPTLTSPSSGQRQVELSVTFSGGTCEAQTFTEVGVFDASTSGNMLSRTLLSSSVTLPTGSGSTLTVNYQVNLNN